MAETIDLGTLVEMIVINPSADLLKKAEEVFAGLDKQTLEEVDSAFLVDGLAPLILSAARDDVYNSALLASKVVSHFDTDFLAEALQNNFVDSLYKAKEQHFAENMQAVGKYAHCLVRLGAGIPEQEAILDIGRDVWKQYPVPPAFGSVVETLSLFDEGRDLLGELLEFDAIRGDSLAHFHYHYMKDLKKNYLFDADSYKHVIDSAICALRCSPAFNKFDAALKLSKNGLVFRRGEFLKYGEENVKRFRQDLHTIVDTVVKAAVDPDFFYARINGDLTQSLQRTDDLLKEWIRSQYEKGEAEAILSKGRSAENDSCWAAGNLVQAAYYLLSRYATGAAHAQDGYVERSDMQYCLDDIEAIVSPALEFLAGVSDTYEQVSGTVLKDPRGEFKFDDARSVLLFRGLYDMILTVGKDAPDCISLVRAELNDRFESDVPVEYEIDRMAFPFDDVDCSPKYFLLPAACNKHNFLFYPSLYRGAQ